MESPSLLYFLYHPGFEAWKVGITTSVNSKRIDNFRRNGWEVVRKFERAKGHSVLAVETRFFRWLRKDVGASRYLDESDMPRTSGSTETFSVDALSEYEVIQKLESLFSEIEAGSSVAKE